MTPHLEQPLTPRKNVLWCVTFQLAWNQARQLIGEDLHFVGEPPMVAALNRGHVSPGQIDDASCVTLAGWVRDDIIERIRREVAKRFGPTAAPRLIPDRRELRPQDIVAYAYLYKDLEFPTAFERLDEPLHFDGTAVQSFGVGPYKSAQQPMYEQVAILDYRSEEDFAIELRTKTASDQVVLAKTAPRATLQETVDAVLARVKAATPSPMLVGDRLQVPKLNFDVRWVFNELMYRKLLVRNPNVAPDLWVLAAEQDTRFQMNEAGVKLRSEAGFTLGCSATVEPMPTHLLIFDQPFLLLMKRRDAEQPYFALWVDNAELLVAK